MTIIDSNTKSDSKFHRSSTVNHVHNNNNIINVPNIIISQYKKYLLLIKIRRLWIKNARFENTNLHFIILWFLTYLHGSRLN